MADMTIKHVQSIGTDEELEKARISVTNENNRVKDAPICAGLSADHTRCTVLGIDAEIVAGERGQPMCHRQVRGWLGRAIPCGIPAVLSKPYPDNSFRKHDDMRQAATLVLNEIAMEENCKFVSITDIGPLCRVTAGPCLRPQGHRSCHINIEAQKYGTSPSKPEEAMKIQLAHGLELARVVEGK
jgi:hypothetical protein